MPKVEIYSQSWGDRVVFWCPGCNESHPVNVPNEGNEGWTFNGDTEKPTFTPSVLVRLTKLTEKGNQEIKKWQDDGFPPRDPDLQFDHIEEICHSYVTDGRIQFLGDSTHHLSGQTVDLPEIPS